MYANYNGLYISDMGKLRFAGKEGECQGRKSIKAIMGKEKAAGLEIYGRRLHFLNLPPKLMQSVGTY